MRLLIRLALGILGLVVLLAAGLAAAWTLAPGRMEAFAARQLAQAMSAPGRTVSIGRLDLAAPATLRLHALSWSDGRGPFATLRQVSLTLSPAALASGTVALARVAVDGLTLARPPEASAGAPGGFGLPRPPLAIRLDDITAPDIVLGAPVLGEAVHLAFRGRASAGTGGGLKLEAHLTRTDGPGGQAEAALSYAPGRTLDVTAHLQSPQGGAVSRLLGLPDLPALTLDVSGSGPLPGWTGTLALIADGRHCGDAALTLDRSAATLLGRLRGSGPAWRIALSGDAAAACLPAGLPRALLPQGAGFVAETTWPDARHPVLDRLEVDGDPIRLQAHGQADLDRDRASLHIAVTGAPLTVLAGTGPLGGLAALAADVTGPPQGPWEARLSGAVTDLKPATPWERGWLTQPLNLSGQMRLDPRRGDLAITRLALGNAAFALDGQGRLGNWGRSSRILAHVNAALPKGENLPGLGITTGKLALTLALDGDLRTPKAQLAISGGARDLAPAQAAARDLLGAAPRLAARLDASASAITLTQLRLDGAALHLTGQGGYAPGGQGPGGQGPGEGRIHGQWSLDLPRLAALPPWLGGQPTGSLRAEGTVAGTPAQPQGSLNAKLTAPSLEAALAARFRRQGQGLLLDGIRFQAPQSRLDGRLAVADDGAEGELKGQVALGPWSAVIGQPLAGAVTVDARLRRSKAIRNGQSLTLAVRARNLALGGDRAGMLRLDADLAGPASSFTRLAPTLADAPAGTIRVELTQAALGRALVTASRAELTLAPPDSGRSARRLAPRAARLAASARGTAFLAGDAGGRATPFTLDGAATLDQGRTGAESLNLARLEARLNGTRWHLSAPATLSREDETWRLSPLDVAVTDGKAGAGTLKASGLMTPKSLAATLQARNLPLALIALAVPGFDLTGRMDGTLSLSGTPQAPQAQAHLALAGRRPVAPGRPNPPFRAQADGQWREGRVQMSGRLDGGAGLALRASADLPLLWGASGPRLPEDGSVNGQVAGTADLGLVGEALPLGGSALGGTARLDAALSGTLAAPRLSGRLTTRDGRFENYVSGFVVQNVTATLDAAPDGRITATASGTDGDGGRLALSGGGQVTPRLAYTVNAHLTDFRVLAMDEVNATASGDLALTGDADAGRLSGRIQVGRGEYRLLENAAPEVSQLDVTEINVPPALAQARAAAMPPTETGQALALGLDLTLNIPGRFRVSGRGLDSEWRGRLAVGGTTADPRISGTVTALRGTYNFLGLPFSLDPTSQVVFDGGPEIDPRLAVTATTTAHDVTAQVAITGRASNPQVALSSTPPLPSDEILSRLLFGQGVGQLTPIQGLELAQAAAQMSGRFGGGASIMDSIRRVTGLDRLEFGAGSQGKTGTVSAGKYIGNNVYVGVKQGTDAGSGAVNVEVEVTPHVTVDSEAGAQAGASVGLNWKWDY